MGRFKPQGKNPYGQSQIKGKTFSYGEMTKLYDDSNWREESIPYYTGRKVELLMDGPKSLSQSWVMGAMYNEWKRRNGYIS